jgi:RhtB (resistance to homoserine/threonine) family protein
MASQFPIFLGVSALVILTPGPDTVLVTKNAALHGRRTALGTSFGVSTGLLVWTVTSALGVASLVRASATAFTVLKLAGALYLLWLGVGALRSAGRLRALDGPRRPIAARHGYRQGILSNLGNPKIAVFFTSLLPQFVGGHRAVFGSLLLLGCVFVLMTLAWLSVYSLLASRAALVLQRPRVKAAIDRVTGVVLIGFGLRLATEHR